MRWQGCFASARQSRRTTSVLCALAAGLVLVFGPGCREEGGGKPVRGSGARGAASAAQHTTLGELAYAILRANLARSADNPQGKVAALDARKDDFVAAVDTIVPPDVTAGLGATVQDVRALVLDGTLPRLTEGLAGVLELLANDPADPQQHALRALVTLAGSRPPVDGATARRLLGRLFAYPDLERLLQAIGRIAAAHDGLDAAGRPSATERDLITDGLAALSAVLRDLERPSGAAAQPSAAAAGLVDTLLRPIQLRGGQQVGAPAWVVRLDRHGNPQVGRDAAGRLYAPFVDRDGDGAADVDADGVPIDAQGRPIDRPPFGRGPGYDAEGRALADGGQLLYVYVDAKRTPLGQLLAMQGELLAASDPFALVRALDALAPRERRLDPQTGRPYEVYAAGHPLHDLLWAVLELFRYRDAPKVLQSLAALIRHDEAKAERLLVKLAQVVRIVRSMPAAPGAGQGGPSLLDDLVPLLDRAFEQGRGGQSAARLLLDAFSREQRRLRNLPLGFARMLRYHDYDRRLPAGPGQPSIMERLLDMMAEADQCDVWPFGNLAEFYLDAMAGNKRILWFTISAETINLLMDISVLRSLLCSQISEHNVRALGGFARSGALDAMKPIAKAFSDAGQTATLKRILLALQPNYAVRMRPHEPALAQVLESGLLEVLFEILDDMNTVRVPGTGEPVAGAVADFLAALVDDDRGVRDRRGLPVTSLVHLVLEPLERMGERVRAAGLSAELQAATNALLDVALATVSDGRGGELMRHHGLVPLAAALLARAADALSVLPWSRNADITRWQQRLAELFGGRELPVLIDVLLAVDASPDKPVVRSALVNLLTPNLAVRHDVYGALLEVTGALIQTRTDPTALVDLLRFAGRALDPARGWSPDIVRGLLRLLDGQNGSVLVGIVRRALDQGPNGDLRAPLDVILEIFEQIEAQGTAPVQPLTVDSLRAQLLELVELLRDPEHGLAHIWNSMRAQASR